MLIIAAPAGSSRPHAPIQPRSDPNLALAPRCGARTREGCPCRAPAFRGKLHCRMHGGHSTGPRTAEEQARLRSARTTRGRTGAEARTNRAHLPPELVAGLGTIAPELSPPPWPTGALGLAEDRAAMQAEATALAPWKRAIAATRQARRRAADTQSSTTANAALQRAEPHSPERPPAADSASRHVTAIPQAPEATGRRPPPVPPCARRLRNRRGKPAHRVDASRQAPAHPAAGTPCTGTTASRRPSVTPGRSNTLCTRNNRAASPARPGPAARRQRNRRGKPALRAAACRHALAHATAGTPCTRTAARCRPLVTPCCGKHSMHQKQPGQAPRRHRNWRDKPTLRVATRWRARGRPAGATPCTRTAARR